jgi:hypothetical protein
MEEEGERDEKREREREKESEVCVQATTRHDQGRRSNDDVKQVSEDCRW